MPARAFAFSGDQPGAGFDLGAVFGGTARIEHHQAAVFNPAIGIDECCSRAGKEPVSEW